MKFLRLGLSLSILILNYFLYSSERVMIKKKLEYIGGYYWSEKNQELKSESINASLLTHLYYAFVDVHADGTLTVEHEEKGFVSDLLNLKVVNPDLKLLFSYTNINDSFSRVVSNETLRKTLVRNSKLLISKYQYDGIDLDWEFPTAKDIANYSALLKEFSEEFTKDGYLLTAAVPAIPIYSDPGYNVSNMAKYLDIINIMTYAYYGTWSNTTGQNAPLYSTTLDTDYERSYLNVDASIQNWLKAGATKDKLAVGLPFYGRTFILEDPAEHGIHAPSRGGGTPAAVTYYEILQNYNNYTTVWNDEQKSPYKYFDATWLAYDNEESIEAKVNFAIKNNLYGVFVWQIGGDDIDGAFSKRKQPLLNKINDAIKISKN